ncbi:hypothetical protein L9F63_018695, partial [Diploptera punctata]
MHFASFFTFFVLLYTSSAKNLQPQMYSLHVHSDIRYRFAHTLVSSSFANPANSSREASFSVVLPDTAFISAFLIEDDSGVYEAYVKDKDSAKKEYTDAVKKGKTAAHVAMSARDSNLFTVSVNVEPRRKVTFNLTYEELLIRKLGTYSHVINLDPGQVVLDMSVRVTIQESSRISYLHVPSFRTTNEVLDDMVSGDDPLARIHRTDPYTAVVTWEPTPEQQKETAAQGLRGQLFVKYDVDREQHPQQILVNDGYFVHFFAPPDLPPLAKHVTFVLDVSTSMMGRKLSQLKSAMYKILSDLRPSDFFSIVRFSSRAKVWDGKTSLNKLNKKNPEFDPVIQATEKNINQAKTIIGGFESFGGTNIYMAMKVGLQVNRLGKKQWRSKYTNAGSRQEHRHPEPMIIFLTDGDPTEGKTDINRIITSTTNRNKKIKASIFCLALGDDAEFDFLKKLSRQNSGFARKIYEASDTALQLTDFYKEVASPLLANVTFKYLSQQVESVSLTQKHFYYFYSGSELVVSGHLQRTTPAELMECEVKGRSPDGLVRLDPTELPIVLQYESLQESRLAGIMERMWAYLSIQQLLDRSEKKSSLAKQAAELALKYSFVTPVTSLVVVKPDGTTNRAEAVKNSDVESTESEEDTWIPEDTANRNKLTLSPPDESYLDYEDGLILAGTTYYRRRHKAM